MRLASASVKPVSPGILKSALCFSRWASITLALSSMTLGATLLIVSATEPMLPSTLSTTVKVLPAR